MGNTDEGKAFQAQIEAVNLVKEAQEAYEECIEGKKGKKDGAKAVEKKFESNPKHSTSKKKSHNNANPEPKNPQQSLDKSVELPGNTTRRVAANKETNEFSVFDEHRPGKFHGHSRGWSELDNTMRSTLIKSGQVTKKGKIK